MGFYSGENFGGNEISVSFKYGGVVKLQIKNSIIEFQPRMMNANVLPMMTTFELAAIDF